MALAFPLLMLPATAMGATLPILVRALAQIGTPFERALGGLYGWNTLGAVAGALAGEVFLIERFGLRGTGVVAALLNFTASGMAFALSGRSNGLLGQNPPPETAAAALTPRAFRLLVAAFLAGGILLSLEVVWFRFMLLFAHGTSLAFATMLWVVLLGVALGGLIASRWLAPGAGRERYAPQLALLAGGFVIYLYSSFGQTMGSPYTDQGWVIFVLSAYLMLPVCGLSGALFTCIGVLLQQDLRSERRTAGLLTLANTVGAMLGPLVAGLYLLPRLGMEISFFTLAAAYGLVAWCALPARTASASISRRETATLLLAGLVFGLAAGLFPFGLMRNHYLRGIAERYGGTHPKIAALREGLTETIVYLREDLLGEASYYRLLTNGLSMSSSQVAARRYMKLFVYLPVALHPSPESALLISYGVGSTAKALTDTATLKTIDIVDISREIVEASRVAFPPETMWPPDDPRVRVHIEDGRFFLLATDRSFDIITAEPPPPKYAGIENLYSREYFELIHRRLAPGGLATYWLPVYQLEIPESQAIVSAFCAAFRDCSLWSGAGPEWMLVGTRGAGGGVTPEHFAAQWRDPVVGPEMEALGFERPEQLGTLFLGDASFLERWASGAPPLEDDRPKRLASRAPRAIDPRYYALTSAADARERFEQSPFVRKLWPEPIRAATLLLFDEAAVLDRHFWRGYFTSTAFAKERVMEDLIAILTRSDLRTLPLLLLGSDADEQRIVARVGAARPKDPALAFPLALRALSQRDYRQAAEYFDAAASAKIDAPDLEGYRFLSRCLAGDRVGADSLPAEARKSMNDPHERAVWRSLEARCDELGAAGALVVAAR
jgi:predicted membrane-bound spermidine synthase